MISARVAGVPSPRSLSASRRASSSTSLPAVSIAESRVASLKRGGGLVVRFSLSASTQRTDWPGASGGSSPRSSSSSWGRLGSSGTAP